MKDILLIIALLSPLAASAQERVTFSYSDSLLQSSAPSKGKSTCQPLRGDSAMVLETTRGMGVEVAKVRVTSGRCAETIGWVGYPRIQAASRTSSTDPAEVRFSYRDSLLKTDQPSDGKSDCQPLKGDHAQILTTKKLEGVEIAKVKIVSGRCNGTVGWAGLPRLESGNASTQ